MRSFLPILCIAVIACSGDDPPSAGTAGAPAADGGGTGGTSGDDDAGTSPSDAGGGSGGSGAAAGAGGHAAEPEDGPTGRVRGRVLGLEPDAAAAMVISAGGVSVTPTAAGHFLLTGVRAGEAVSVFARALEYSTGHARVRVREGETTALLLEVAKLPAEVLADPNAAREVRFGVMHSLQLPAGALETVYGTPPLGEVRLTAATLPARLAPAGLFARTARGPVRLGGAVVLQLSAAQPRAALRLTGKAALVLHGLAAGAAGGFGFYRFDEGEGMFVPAASARYEASDQTLRGEVDRFGIYAAASPSAADGCRSGRITRPDGSPLAGAAVRFAGESQTEGGLLWTDRDGRFCLPLPANETFSIRALGVADGRVFELPATNLPPAEAAAACGSASCNDLGVRVANESPVGCVRGRIHAPGARTVLTVRAIDAERTATPALAVAAGAAFCLDLTSEQTLEVSGAGLRCGEPRGLATPSRITSCGEDSCADLGEIVCCSTFELCGDGFDGDCDARIDEGCNCGGSCSDAQSHSPGLPNHCCTEAGGCGFRYPPSDAVDHCFAFTEPARYSAACPSQLLSIRGQSSAPTGCCRSDGQCGLNFGNNCLPRSEVQHLTGMSLAPLACVYTP